jgi:hypothetical protein
VSPFYADPYVDAAEQYLKDKAEGVEVDDCTCEGGSYGWAHEPGCGLEQP